MSPDGTAAAPATTNGASGAQSGAPAVAPTPQNGEGAVAAEPKVEAPPKFQPIKRKLKFGDGTEEEYEVPDEASLDRMRLGQKLADKSRKELLDARRKEAARKEAIAKKDFGPLKELGFDPEAFYQERLKEEARRYEMTEEQRAADDRDKARTAAEARAKNAEARLQAIQDDLAEKEAWATEQPRLHAAMQAEGMIGDTFAMNAISEVAQEFLDHRIDAPVEVIVKEAAARDAKKFSERLGKLTPDSAPQLWTKLPPEVRKVFGYLAAQDHVKARSNIPAPAAPVPPQREAEPRPEQSGGLSPRDWLRKLQGG